MSIHEGIHEMYRLVKFHTYDTSERELLLETAHGNEEIHFGVWKDDIHNPGSFIALTPEEALEVGENLVARALALLTPEQDCE